MSKHSNVKEVYQKLSQLSLDGFEIFAIDSENTTIDVKDQKVDALSRAQDTGISIRILKNQRMGFSFSSSLAPAALEKMIQTAEEMTRIMPADPFHALGSLANRAPSTDELIDQEGWQMRTDKKIAMALELESQCRGADSRITGMRSASFKESRSNVLLLDSTENEIEYERTRFSLTAACKAEEAGESLMGFDFQSSSQIKKLDLTKVAQTAAERATELLGAKPAPSMKCPAILRNTAVSNLLSFLSSSFSLEQMEKGRSLLASKQGSRAFSPLISIIDDPLLKDGYSSRPFDAEGTPSARTFVVEKGFFKSPLSNLYYAKKLGEGSTSNAQRGLTSPPSVGVSNIYIEKGNQNLNQMIQGVSQGILLTELMGLHTCNPITGDFSLGASGFLIENGLITQAVKGFAVAGNILKLLNGVTEVGSDLLFQGNIGAPSLQVEEISVGGNQ
jgi:PmbA protein